MADPTTDDVLRAWRDEAYYRSLPPDVRSRIPLPPDDVDDLHDRAELPSHGSWHADGWPGVDWLD